MLHLLIQETYILMALPVSTRGLPGLPWVCLPQLAGWGKSMEEHMQEDFKGQARE